MDDERKYVEFYPSGGRVPHGKITTYNLGCRCLECTEANRVYRGVVQQGKRLAQTRANAIPATVVHGKRSTYVNWGCRCTPCTLAQAEQVRSYYQRNLSRDARNQRAKNSYVIGYVDGATGVEQEPEKVVER